MEAEEPDLARSHPVPSPTDMPQWPAVAVARSYRTVAKGFGIHGNPGGCHCHDVTRKSQDDLGDRLSSAWAIAS
jgi:hypothetical protein